MSSIKEKIEKLKNLFISFGDQPQEDSVEKTYTAAELKISDTSVGGKVELINSDGTLSPAPDGEYLYEDGNEYTVVAGLITNVVADSPEEDKAESEMASAPEAPKEEDKPAEEPKANDNADLKAQVEAQAQAIDELKQAVADLQKSISDDAAKEQSMTAQFNQKLDELNASLKSLASIPVEFSKTSQSNVVKDSKDEKINDYVRIMASLKK